MTGLVRLYGPPRERPSGNFVLDRSTLSLLNSFLG